MALLPSNRDEENATVERLLSDFRAGAISDADLLAALHRDIRKLAQMKLRKERPNHTLQATEVANMVYLRIASSQKASFALRDAPHLIHLLARLIDNVLTDHARNRHAQKRGGPNARAITLTASFFAREQDPDQVLMLRQAREQLELLHPRQAEVIRLRHVVGLSEDETADILGVSRDTVKVDARKARAFLQVLLSDQATSPV